MSTSPLASELDILDLRHFSARQLRPLLEEEARLWRERLRWDYDSSIELLLQYIDSRVLEGYVAQAHGRVCGYAFAVYEGNKAVIGDAFAAGLGAQGDGSTTRSLLVHMLELLRHTPMVERIESQILLSDAGEFAEVFAGLECRIYPRLFLECDLTPRPQLAGARESAAAGGLPPNLVLAQWVPQDYQAAGELIHAAYAGHMDSEINDQYRTLHGALRFLHNIVRFPGCGVFDPVHSWVLRDRDVRTPVGLVLASKVGGEVAHITQFCVAPQYRGAGLGSVLLRHSLAMLRGAGFQAITLTVTEANAPAVRLYERFGFRRRHRFDAMVLDPPGRR
ncbi:MAG: GNAT family N-acetyltransferase [Acidobacteriota bacterium]|nr:GNAT family N-acetyltransferase [Acidobacteriota bacterium]